MPAALFPQPAVRDSGFAVAADGTRIPFEESGDPAGMPVVVLHGGPGSGTRPHQRRFFKAAAYRIITFDQRGTGRSGPSGLEDNTTTHLVEDMETLRRHLAVERWLVFGGSWGATLSLCYAQCHPERVRALLLRGTLLGRRRDLDWFFGDRGAACLAPAAYRRFLAALPPAWRGRPIAGYAALLGGGGPAALAAAAAWGQWESAVAQWPRAAAGESPPVDAAAVRRYAVAAHYARHGFFLDPDRGALIAPERLADIPGMIVHGRLDLVCPVDNALTLHRAWPAATLRIIEDGGHLDADPAIAGALVEATERLCES